MKQEEIKQLSTADLVEKINQEKTALSKTKMSHKVSPIENPLKIRVLRKTIARMKTELKKRQSAEPVKNN